MLSEQLSIKDWIPVGIALAGYLAGVLHNTAANVRERRKAVNSVAYSLLEMRWEVKTSNPSLIMAALRQFLLSRFGAQADIELSKPEVQQFFRQFLASVANGDRDGIGKRYSDAVRTLTPFYPIIAYRLSGESIIRIDTRIRTHYDQLRDHPIIAGDPNTPVSVALIEDRTLSQAFDEAVRSLSGDLQEVSSCCGLLTRMRIRRTIKEQDERVTSDKVFKLLTTTFEPILPKFSEPECATPRGSEP
jgi:hypothetical protein